MNNFTYFNQTIRGKDCNNRMKSKCLIIFNKVFTKFNLEYY